MPLSVLWILAPPAPVVAEAISPVPGPVITTMMVFGDGPTEKAPPPLASDLAVKAPAKAPELKPYDPAPLWLDTLFVTLGARPSYIARDERIGLDECDARDPRCDRAHADLARLDAEGEGIDLVGSALGTAIGLLTGPAEDRKLFGSAIKLRARGRFVGIVMDW